MELKPGLMIAHYRLIEKIGAGGMGIVWSALDTRLDTGFDCHTNDASESMLEKAHRASPL
jgi:hypothetical protein